MSKPKPGLGKGIVRTLAHSSQHVTTYTAGGNAAGSVGQLVPVTAINHPLPSTSTTFASSSHTRRRRGSADGFASLGLPTYDEGYPRNVGGSNAGGGGADGLRSTSMVTNGPTGSGSSTTWPLSSNLSTLSAQSSTPYLSLLPLWDTSSQVVAESSASAANLLLTDVVQPFRPVAARPYSTSSTARDRTATLSSVSARLSSSNSGRAHLSTISTPIATSPASPEIPPSLLSSLSLPSLANWNSLLSDKTSLFADRNILSDIGLFGADRPFSFTTKFTSPYSFLDPSNGKSHADILVTEIVTLPPSPSPNPEARPPRQSEVHPALSSSTPSQSDSTLSTGQQTTSAYPFSALAVSSATSDNAVSSSEAESSTAAQKTYSSNLVFHLGASGSAKERPPSRRPPSNSSSARSPSPRPRSFPIPDVSPPSASEWRSIGVGEDAYFARMDGMCVADGVGGWARSGKGGADAGRWSRLLTHFCEKEVDEWWKGAPEYLSSAGKGNSADSEAGKPKERRRIRLSIGGGGGGGADLSGGWAQKVWKDGERAKEGMMREESRRRPLDPVEIMQRGYEKCLSCFLKEGINGSSTCLLALLHHSTLHIANLGDCCLLLIRAGEVIFRTDEMQHAFNFPLQLGTHSRDEPMKDAKRYDVGVGKGDVVVVGSDGLMDNLFDEDILDTLSQFAPPLRSAFPSESSQAETTPSAAATPAPKPSIFSPSSFFSRSRDSTPPTPPDPRSLPAFSPQKVSEELCRRARAVSEQTSATTPFMVRAIDEGIDFVGGKKDDISVLVGVIGDRDGSDGLALHTI